MDCKKIETRATQYKCFLIQGLCSDIKLFYNPEIWPEKVEICRYFDRKAPPGQASNNNSGNDHDSTLIGTNELTPTKETNRNNNV